MNKLWLFLIIPGAIIAYFTIGFFVNLLVCKIDNVDWRDEIDGNYVLMILVWPVTLVLCGGCIFFRWIMTAPVRLLEHIAETTRKDRKDE